MLLEQFRPQFNPWLDAFVNQKLATINALTNAAETTAMRDYLSRFVQHGKRVRPYLVYLLAHENTTYTDQQVQAVCLAHELVHTFALIHDDLMDLGTTRHGLPTYHLAIQKLNAYTDVHAGISQAILVGDLVLARATQAFTQAVSDPSAHHLFFRMLDEVMIGQSGDIHLSHSPLRETNTAIIAKDTLKSAHYTFCKPLMMGATLGWRNDVNDWEALGISLGLAYQLRDDYLDLIGGHDNKTCFSDLQEGNQTLLLWYALEHLTPADRELLASYRWKQLTPDEQGIATNLIKQAGAHEYALGEIARLLTKANEQLTALVPAWSPIALGILDLIQQLTVTA